MYVNLQQSARKYKSARAGLKFRFIADLYSTHYILSLQLFVFFFTILFFFQ